MKATWFVRLDKLERAQHGGDWRTGSGLSSLLKAAEQWEREDPDGEPTDAELEEMAGSGNGMAKLLLEARQWCKEHGGGPC
jgi:hypothetical protein